MSLAFNVERVTAVLLADGWHDVLDGSFTLDSYEFVEGEDTTMHDAYLLHGGGNSGICATGFSFHELAPTRTEIGGPLSSVVAIRYSRKR